MKTLITITLATALAGCASIPMSTATDFIPMAQSICNESHARDEAYSSSQVDKNLNDPSGRNAYADCVLRTSSELSESENNKRHEQIHQQNEAVEDAIGLGIFGAIFGLCAAGGC